MTLHHVFEDIEYDWIATVNNLLCTLYSLYDTTLNELADNEWLVKFGCHKLWNTTLTHVELRTYNDYRTCRVVNTLTEEVLAETSLLTLERVRE